MTEILVVSGLLAGAQYLLVGLGVVILRRYCGVLNFAQGAFATLAAYVAYSLQEYHLPYLLSFVIPLVGVALISLILGEVMARFFPTASELISSMATFGPTLLIIGVVSLIWGSDVLGLKGPPGGNLLVPLGYTSINTLDLATIVGSLAIVLAIELFVRRTRAGLALRALADNETVACLSGIQPRRYRRILWLGAGALAAISGLIVTPEMNLSPYFLTSILIFSFTAAVLGGLSSVLGLAGGAAVLGIVTAFVEWYLSGEYASLVSLILLVAVLALRPEGIFGARKRRDSNAGIFVTAAAVPGSKLITTVLLWVRRQRRNGVPVVLGRNTRRAILYVPAFALVVAVPAFASGSLVYVMASAFAIAIAIAGQNIISGFSGQLSLAQGGLMLVGAYGAGVIVSEHGLPPLLGLLVGGIIAALAGLVIGVGVTRLGGIYLGMVTLALDLAVVDMANVWTSVTKGQLGIPLQPFGIGSWTFFSGAGLFYSSLGILIVFAIFARLVTRGRAGLHLRAGRDDRVGAEAAGVTVRNWRLLAFVISGFAAGVAGALSAYQTGVIAPSSFGLWTAIYILLASAIGGEESLFWGPLLGALFIVLVPFFLSNVGGAVDIVLGGLAFGVMMTRQILQAGRRAAAYVDARAEGLREPEEVLDEGVQSRDSVVVESESFSGVPQRSRARTLFANLGRKQ